MAPARTGRDNNNNTAVINTAHENRGIKSINIPNARRLPIVEIKLTAPKIDLAPARCREKMAKSTDAPECAIFLDNGGYTVHPVPAPLSTNEEERSMIRAGRSNQNLMLFIRGKAISGAPSINGTSQFPNPPIKIGITMKKTIINACAVTTTL